MDPVTLTVILIIAFALAFNLSNGWNDAANAIATVISTRVLSPGVAILFGSALNFAGALVSGEVAKTVGAGIAQQQVMTGAVLLSAVVTAPIWVTWCTLKGLPMSCSHSLLGALIGAAIAAGGAPGLKLKGILEIVYGVVVSPILGFVLGFLLARFITRVFARVRPRVGSAVFGKLQLVSAGAMSFAHGTGDAQKAMGIISAALLYAGWTQKVGAEELPVPFWVKLLCAVTMALGTAIGGRAVIRTLGSRLAHLRTYQGFSAETGAAATILANTLYGVPISTTHSITGAVLGVGAERGVKMVRWGVGRKIVFTWIVTFPICIAAGALVHVLLKLVGIG